MNRSAPWVGSDLSGAPCSGSGQAYGPFDYMLRAQYEKNLAVVENHHFSPNVENLVGDTASVMGNLNYTLMAWPNHHRALNSVIRARLRKKEHYSTTGYTPAECYLERAINYSPKDGVTYMLKGNLLQQMGRPQKALESYEIAEQLLPNDALIKYNVGLALVELRRYEEAETYAREVYARNFPYPGLKRKLKEKGYWKDD